MIDKIMEGISKAIANIVSFLIFWKDWDKLSTYLFIGLVAFIIIAVLLLRRLSNQKPGDPNSIRW